MKKKKKIDKKIVINGIIITVFMLVSIAITILLMPVMNGFDTVEDQLAFQEKIDSFGFFGMLALFGVQVLQIVIPFLPGQFIDIMAGVMYNPMLAWFILAAGLVLATIIIFLLVKWLGQPFIDLFVTEKRREKFKFIQNTRKVEILFFILFFIPGTPKDVLIFLAPLTSVKLTRFIVVSVIARTPGWFLSIFMGNSISLGNNTLTFVFVGIILLTVILFLIFRKKIYGYLNKFEIVNEDPYLILCDLDSTLLNDKKKISNSTVLLIKKIVKKGNYFVICTGRPFQSAIKFYRRLGIKNMPIVCDNGTRIVFVDALRKITEEVKFELSPEVAEFMKETEGLYFWYLTGDYKEIYTNDNHLTPFWLNHQTHAQHVVECKYSEIPDPQTFLTVWVKEEKVEAFEEALNNKKYKNLSIDVWGLHEGKKSYDFFGVNGNKGESLKYLKERYKIKDEHTIAFGDQLNDISMLEEAHQAVIMCDSNQELLTKYPLVTNSDSNNDGVRKYIQNNMKYLYERGK